MLKRLFSYENISGKIMTLAKVMFVLGAISAVITGIAIIVIAAIFGGKVLLIGILLALLATFVLALLSFVSTWLLYGYGQMIEKLDWTSFFLSEMRDSLNKIEGAIVSDNSENT